MSLEIALVIDKNSEATKNRTGQLGVVESKVSTEKNGMTYTLRFVSSIFHDVNIETLNESQIIVFNMKQNRSVLKLKEAYNNFYGEDVTANLRRRYLMLTNEELE